jgi:hypothetical protein
LMTAISALGASWPIRLPIGSIWQPRHAGRLGMSIREFSIALIMPILENNQRGQFLEEVVERLHSWKGMKVKVIESLSRNRQGGGYDRHFSTRSSFEMVIEYAGWAISGGNLMILGVNENFNYEVAFDHVVSGDVNENEVSLVEHFESHTERSSIISLFG